MNAPMPSQRLAPLRMLAERAETQAVRAFAGAQEALVAADAQLRELERYQGGMTFSESAASLPGLMVNHEHFRLRLANAIVFQRQTVEKLQKRVETTRAAWNLARDGRARIERLTERSLGAERRIEDMRQQREYDEISQRLHAATQMAMES